MTRNRELSFIKKLIYQDKNFDEAIKLISNSIYLEDSNFQELLGLAFFSKRDFSLSSEIFSNINDYYKQGYCQLLLGNINKAYELFKQATPSPAQNWSQFFCELFITKIETSPSYLQIRAFLERDLNIFLKNECVDYVQKIVDISDFLFEINPETNKIVSRTFLYNKYYAYAKEYFNRALDYTRQDAELFYLLGLYYLETKNIDKAKDNFSQAINLNENYIPAKNYLMTI